MIRAILIADASHMFRNGLNAWLSANFPLCRIFEVESAEEALVLAEAEHIDVALIEIRLPGMIFHRYLTIDLRPLTSKYLLRKS